MSTFLDDPRKQGALCDVCPLATERAGGPVLGEHRHNSDVLAIGQEPGGAECAIGRPFVGPSGRVLDKALQVAGLPRYTLSVTNVVACQPPKGNIRAYEKRLVARNRKREKEGKAPLRFPSHCCAPRLRSDLRRYEKLIPLGAVALNSVLSNVSGGITKARGTVNYVYDELGRAVQSVLPTLSPAKVLRDMRWLEIFEDDLRRATRLFNGTLQWSDPTVIDQPSVDQLEDLLLSGRYDWTWRGHQAHIYDVETNRPHPVQARPTLARMHCIGIGTPDWVTVVQWYDIESGRSTASEPSPLCYSDDEREAIFAILRRWATRTDLLKMGWNSGVFDRMAMEANLGVTPAPHMDLMLCHKSVYPAYPHDLQFAGSQHLDITNWKGDHHGKDEPTNVEERVYNMRDVAATARLVEPLYAEVVRRDQIGVMLLDHDSQSACVGMHRAGMAVDQRERERLSRVLVGGECQPWAKPAGDPYGPDTAANGPSRWVREGSDKPGCGTWRPVPKTDRETGAPVQRSRKDQKMGQVPLWTLRTQKILAMADVDLSDISRRTKKIDAENEGRLRAFRAGQEKDGGQGLSQRETDEGWELPTATEAGLDLDSLAFNPMSYPQVRSVLFEDWDLEYHCYGRLKEKDLYTDSGEISTGDAVLRVLLMSDLPPLQRRFIQALRMVRRHAKLYGTYVRPMRLPTGDKKADKGCKTWSDGRIHSNWASHTPITGRFSSSFPNNQNWNKLSKAQIVAQAGCVFVGADMDQLELRIAAARWGLTRYLEAFAVDGFDPHQMTMEAIWGRKEMMNWDGAPSSFGIKDFARGSFFEMQRSLAKAIQYASQYAATLETIYRLVSSSEDAKGRLIYAHLTRAKVGAMVERWLKGVPEIELGWAREEQIIEDNGIHPDERWGWTAEPVTGRRRDFYPTGDEDNHWASRAHGDGRGVEPEKVNYNIQASAAGIMNKIMRELVHEIPFGCWGPGTGIVNQCHDSITVECPIEVADRVHAILTRVMNREEPAYPDVRFTAEADVGYRWSEV